jgi:integrase
MPRIAKELTAIEIGRLKAPGYHFAGGVAGLILQVTESGSRSWVLRTTVGSRRRDIGLGGYPSVTLAAAKTAARAAREQIRQGEDPVQRRAAARSALAAQSAASITFKEAAERYIAANEAGWKNSKHAAQWGATLEKYVYPSVGKIQVAAVETSHVVTILEPIWTNVTETAGRLRGRIEAILDWATARGYRKGENPARWKGHLSAILPAVGKVQRVRHHSALDYRHVGAFMASLSGCEGIGARALEFSILTTARSGEARGAQWSEIDPQAQVWTIGADRMKAGREHRVPLSDAAVKLLASLPRLKGSGLIFPNGKGTQLSDMTLTAVIRRMHQQRIDRGDTGWSDSAGRIITVHGFRSTFRDWAGETTAHPREVIEHALAHQLADKAEASYARGTLFEKRRHLMADWAASCAKVTSRPAGEVVPIRQRS